MTNRCGVTTSPARTQALRGKRGFLTTVQIVTIREFRFTTAPDITVLVALDDQQMWRYDESGQDSGTAWKERVFDDSSDRNNQGIPFYDCAGHHGPGRP